MKVFRCSDILVVFIIRWMSCESVFIKWFRLATNDTTYGNSTVVEGPLSTSQCLARCYKTNGCLSVNVKRENLQCEVSVNHPLDNTSTPNNRPGWKVYYREKPVIAQVNKNCKEVLNNGDATTGIKTIFPDGINSVQALCIMDVEGGGWTVIQKRESDSQLFLEMWQEYRNGFGDSTSFWLGLENIRLLTSQGTYELRIDMTMDNNTEAIVKYQTFAVGSESAQYPLTVGGYSFVPTYAGQPDPGDALSGNNGMVFTAMDSTPTTDNLCLYNGFWFRTSTPCYYSNLNGGYLDPSFGGILWGNWTGVNLEGNRLLVYTRMMIRPK